jgi:hypothetical protein
METILNLCACKEAMNENHAWKNDAPMVGHRGERTTRMVVGKKSLLARNETWCGTFRVHLC